MKTSMVVLLAALLALVQIANASPIWTTNPDNGRNYSLTNTPDLSWLEAEAEAVTLGGHLATIRNATEEIWVKNTFGTNWWWIGFNDRADEGNFAWISGEPVTYTDWNTGEPNNQNEEDFVGMNIGDTRGWNDFPDWYRMYGVVETSATPEPSSLLLLGVGGLVLIIFKKSKLI